MPARRVTGEQSALGFINETGFCAAFTPGLGVPCLREAIEGRREPKLPEHIQHDRAIIMTWNLKDTLPARKAVYYGKVIAGRPSFIALELLPAFLRLRVAPGGYRKLYERGALSHCGEAGDGCAHAPRRRRNQGAETCERLCAARQARTTSIAR